MEDFCKQVSKGLVFDLYELTMAQAYFNHKRRASATFELFIRSSKRPFYVASGIDDALHFLQDLRFTKENIDYLHSLKLFEKDFLSYLKNFRFQGDVWGMEEPEIVFPCEPILRLSGNLIEVQIVESALLNRINLATTLATKATRVVIAAEGKPIYDFSLRRTQGIEAALAVAKYSYIAGASGTSNIYAGFLYGIPVTGTMAHSFVMTFEKEAEAFLAFAKQFPAKTILLVDTYDTRAGLRSAVMVAKFLKEKGYNLLGIRLDSGDLTRDSQYCRHLLDKEGLIDTSIVASGNLDEYAIEKLINKKAPIDAFGVGTHMGCSSDLPYTDVIYKLVEIKERGLRFIPTMKLSKSKITLPSRKQVFRSFDNAGRIKIDVIALDGEHLRGIKLLKKLMLKGRRLFKENDVQTKRALFMEKLVRLPSYLRHASTDYHYPVVLSKKLLQTRNNLLVQLKRRVLPQL